MGINGINGNGKSLEVLFGGLNEQGTTKQGVAAVSAEVASQQAVSQQAVKISVGEDKTERVAALKAAYQSGADLNKLYKSADVAKALLG